MENAKLATIDNQTLSIFIPAQIRRKRGYVTMLLSNNAEEYQEVENPKNYNEKLVKAFTVAHKWQKMFQDKVVSNFNEIAKLEKTDKSYVAKIFKLNYVAPDIIKSILNGNQPPELKLRDFTHQVIPDLWEEQKEIFGF